MKQEIVNAFDGMTMSAGCEQKIRRAMAEKRPGRSVAPLKRLGTLAAVLALILCLSPTARASARNLVQTFFFPDSDITITREYDEEGNAVSIVGVDTEAPAFAQIEGGRLYFRGNGENIDITDQIKEDAPYFYTHTDNYGMTHYMAVGYSGSLENYGIYEFIWEGSAEDGKWVTGTGRNFLDPETGMRYPWVDIVWEHFNIPWPLPE